MAVPGRKSTVTIALIAMVALLVGVVAAGPATGDPVAGAAKKKCKKGFKKVKKHGKVKCKKKAKAKPVNPSQVVRATLTWSNGGAADVDMDLFAFDSNGKIAGNGTTAIPDSSITADLTGPAGSETFKAHAGTVLSFGVCYTVGGSVHTDYTITYVTADGVSHTAIRAGDGSDPSHPQALGNSAHVNYPGGAPIPDDYCPGTPLIS
jgi:hypothetical protein